jgi:hypothetical protein
MGRAGQGRAGQGRGKNKIVLRVYLCSRLRPLMHACTHKWQANPNATADFEERLFPPFEGVLSMDVAEFTPYVFQILAQLLLYRPNGMSPAFARCVLLLLLLLSVWMNLRPDQAG